MRRGSEAGLIYSFSLPRLLPACRVSLRAEIENRYTGERYRFQEECDDTHGSQIVIDLPTTWCGQLRCRTVRLECRDLLGLIRIRRKVPAELICTVLPAALAPDTAPDLDAALDSAPVLRPKYGGGYSEEHELREYRPGDSANSIHWKLSSKTDALIVREAMTRENDRIYIVLSRVGANDRGLEVLFWLSSELCRRELAHWIVSDRFYSVSNENEIVEALCALLSSPLGSAQRFDASRARCVFRITDGEVSLW